MSTTRSQSENVSPRERSSRAPRDGDTPGRDLQTELVQFIKNRGDVARQEIVDDYCVDVDEAYQLLEDLRADGIIRTVWQDGKTIVLLADCAAAAGRTHG